ncbi:DUF3794 and LysM peptidoglycan-binding domain-containing protein [Thermotalea metallivorans]|uniref:LysM domain-containing protein n=1 Tax=Thermotalea metallivorans TaxID=520762 RepID=A0A140L6L5_9FIRM|nr:SPOCS domain-containing protein [Thermotalea metallivorans]KXG76190.1 hypothetical protein AN619_11470 [Thermotalea metallivorans]
MAVELIRDLLKIDQLVGEEYAQALVEGDIVVPDAKPDISRILSVDGIVNITGKEAVQDKIIVDGIVQFKILYASDGGDQPVYSMNASAGFSQNIDIPGTTAEMNCMVMGEIEHIDFHIVNERKVAVKTVLNLSGRSFGVSKMDILREIHGLSDIQVLKERVRYSDLVGSSSSETIVRENFEIEENMPEIREILRCDAHAVEKETKVTDGKVIVSGMVKTNTLYVGEDDRNPLCLMKHEIPFTHFVEVPAAMGHMDCKIELKVDEVYADVKENTDGEKKLFEIEAIVKITAAVSEAEEKEVIIDAYSPSKKIKIEKKRVSYHLNVGSNASNVIVKETLEIPDHLPEAFRVFNVHVKPVITDYRLVEDKNVMEGIIEANVLYLSQDKDQPIHSFRQEIPFRHFIEIPGVDDSMKADICLSIHDVDYSLINPEQVEVKVNVGASCVVAKNAQVEVVVHAEESDEPVDMQQRPSITIYFVQPGDTLWKIAKRYHTTISELVETNDIQNPNMLMPGDRLIIQKTCTYKI